MSNLLCSKCQTTHDKGASRCRNCGFSFGNDNRNYVSKYTDGLSSKVTRKELTLSKQFYNRRPPLDQTNADNVVSAQNDTEEIFLSRQIDVDPDGYSFDISGKSDKLSNPEIDKLPSADLLKQDNSNYNSDNNHKEDSGVTTNAPMSGKSNVNSLFDNHETKSVAQLDSNLFDEIHCSNCDYLLSDYSPICPRCNLNNIIHPTNVVINDKFQSDHNGVDVNLTGVPVVDQSFINTNHITPEERGEVVNGNSSSIAAINNQRSIDKVVEPNSNDKNNAKVRLEALYSGVVPDHAKCIDIPVNINQFDLNRDTIDPNDTTISSGIHATLFKHNNKWHIENKASNKAIYVQVNSITELKNGDVLLIGSDKVYVFIDESSNSEA